MQMSSKVGDDTFDTTDANLYRTETQKLRKLSSTSEWENWPNSIGKTSAEFGQSCNCILLRDQSAVGW